MTIEQVTKGRELLEKIEKENSLLKTLQDFTSDVHADLSATFHTKSNQVWIFDSDILHSALHEIIHRQTLKVSELTNEFNSL